MIKKFGIRQAVLASLMVAATAHAESDRHKELVMKCAGAFWLAYGGTYGGGESVGSSTIKVFRNRVDALTWYSAEVSAAGDPMNPGVFVRDYEYLDVTRAFYPGVKRADVATTFSWESGPGDAKLDSFAVSLARDALPVANAYARFSYPESGERTFSPSVKCFWQRGEDHEIFYRQ